MADVVQQERQFDFQEYVQVLWRGKWLITGFTAALTVAVGIGTYFQPKVYEAKVTLLAGRENPRLLTSDPIPGERFGQRDYLKTQAAILTSRSLLQGAVKSLIKEGFYGQVDPARLEEKSTGFAMELQRRGRGPAGGRPPGSPPRGGGGGTEPGGPPPQSNCRQEPGRKKGKKGAHGETDARLAP